MAFDSLKEMAGGYVKLTSHTENLVSPVAGANEAQDPDVIGGAMRPAQIGDSLHFALKLQSDLNRILNVQS